jgi:hypothetical protein
VGVVSDEVRALVFHQVQESSVVAWFDPDDTTPPCRPGRSFRSRGGEPSGSGGSHRAFVLTSHRRRLATGNTSVPFIRGQSVGRFACRPPGPRTSHCCCPRRLEPARRAPLSRLVVAGGFAERAASRAHWRLTFPWLVIDALDLESRSPDIRTSFASASDRRTLESPAQQPITARLAGAGSLRHELEALLHAAPEKASARVCRDLLIEENAAGKRSTAARLWACKRLRVKDNIGPFQR